jgi:ribosomal silencing factor RsfS
VGGYSDLFEKLNQYTQDVYKLKPTVDNMIINDTCNGDTYLQKRADNIYTIDSISKHSLSNYSTIFNKLSNEELEIIKNEIKTKGYMNVKASQESYTFTPITTVIVDIVEYTNKNDETNIYFLDSSDRFWKYVSIS